MNAPIWPIITRREHRPRQRFVGRVNDTLEGVNINDPQVAV
jgi:hypothetical protein